MKLTKIAIHAISTRFSKSKDTKQLIDTERKNRMAKTLKK